MTEGLDINRKRLELINLTFDELVEFCLDLLIQIDCMEDSNKAEIDGAFDMGCAKGYAEGRQEEIDRRYRE